ncbi:MAG: hypothetical protein ACP5GS_08390 [Nitrososphaeria archaeon]
MTTSANSKTLGFGYCTLHDEPINEDKYIYKGCWGCHYFVEGSEFPYTFVSTVAKEFGVSESAVRRWIKTGKLKGELFVQVRHTGFLPAPAKYHILKDSVEKLKEKWLLKSATH